MLMKLLALLLLLVTYNCFSQLEIICFDVGQGNCVLLLCSEGQVPPLLIDGGSKSYQNFRPAHFKCNQINKISKRIADFLVDREDKKILVVVSHPDEDHYLWIKDILDAVSELAKDSYVSQIKLGGLKSQYNAPFITFLKSLTEASVLGEYINPVDFVNLKNETTGRQTLFNDDNIHYSLLPAVKTAKKNDASLVVVIDNGHFGMIVAGDATAITTDHILKYDGTNLTKKYLLHAAHHGASTHGSNRLDWIQKIQPLVAVYSSGVNSKLHHPCAKTVTEISSYLTLPTTKVHPLYIGVDGSEMRTYGKGTRNYALTALSNNSWGTLTQGNINFLISPSADDYSQKSLTISCEQHSEDEHPNLKTCILETLMTFPRGILSDDHLTEVNIAAIELDDAPDIDRDLVWRLFESLANKAKELRTLYMQNNTLRHIESLSKVIAIIKRCIHLSFIDWTNNQVPLQQFEASMTEHLEVKDKLKVKLQ